MFTATSGAGTSPHPCQVSQPLSASLGQGTPTSQILYWAIPTQSREVSSYFRGFQKLPYTLHMILMPASSQNSPLLFSYLSLAPWKWQPISDFKVFVLALSNAWNILAERPSLNIPSIHTRSPQVFTAILQDSCYYLKSLLLKDFFIHLSPIDCKTT